MNKVNILCIFDGFGVFLAKIESASGLINPDQIKMNFKFNPISPGLYKNLLAPGGAIRTPLPKNPGKCPMGLKLGRVPQGRLNITFKPKKSQPGPPPGANRVNVRYQYIGLHKGLM